MIKNVTKHRSVWILLVLGFVLKNVSDWRKAQPFHFTDATTEAFVINGGRGFVQDGWGLHSFLPQYKGFITETPVKKIQETGVYTHFLPGPDYFAGILFEVFGDNDRALIWGRTIVLLFFVFSSLYFSWSASQVLFPRSAWAGPLILLGIYIVPAHYRWASSLAGNSWASSFILICMALGMRSLVEGSQSKKPFIWAALCGGLTILFHLEATFVAIAAPLVGGCLALSFYPSKFSKKMIPGLRLSFWAGVGVTLVFLVHFLQVAHYLGGIKEAMGDQIGTALTRSETRWGITRLDFIFDLNRLAYEHFRVPAAVMTLVALIFHSRTKDRRSYLFLSASLALGIIAALAFPMLLFHHSVVHSFRIPRLWILEFLVFWIVLVGNLGLVNIPRRGYTK